MSNKTFDALGLITEDEAVTVTATCTPKEIVGLNIGTAQYVAVVNYGVSTGTVDASNYYTLQLNVSDLTGGTYSPVGDTVKVPATAGQAQIGFTSEQIERLITGASFFEVIATKVGTTATALTYTAFISKI